MFVSTLHIPLSFSVAPNIFLGIFLSNTKSLCIILYFGTRVSQPC
jgi:hypothetical protein